MNDVKIFTKHKKKSKILIEIVRNVSQDKNCNLEFRNAQ